MIPRARTRCVPVFGHLEPKIPLLGKIVRQYWYGTGRPDENGKAVMLAPRGATVLLQMISNEHSALKCRLGHDGPLLHGYQFDLGVLDKDIPELQIYRYVAPIVLTRVTAKDGTKLTGVEVTSRYERDKTGIAVRFEYQRADGRYRSSQMLPDQEAVITATSDDCAPQSLKLSLPEGSIREIELVLDKKAT